MDEPARKGQVRYPRAGRPLDLLAGRPLGRVVLAASGAGVEPAVSALVDAGVPVELVTTPAAAQARLAETTMGRWAGELGARVHLVERLDRASLLELDLGGAERPEADLLISSSAPWILSAEVIDHLGGAALNIHSAPLPEWRGGSVLSWQMLAGQRHTGLTVHVLTPGIDEGPVVAELDVCIPEQARFPFQWQQAIMAAHRPLWDSLVARLLAGDPLLAVDQDAERAAYYPRLFAPHHGWIDWSWPAADIERFVLAFSHPHAGARCRLRGETAVIFDVRVIEQGGGGHPFTAGLVVGQIGSALRVATVDGVLEIDLDDLDAPRPARPGDRFWSPGERLDAARCGRALFGDEGVRIVGVGAS